MNLFQEMRFDEPDPFFKIKWWQFIKANPLYAGWMKEPVVAQPNVDVLGAPVVAQPDGVGDVVDVADVAVADVADVAVAVPDVADVEAPVDAVPDVVSITNEGLEQLNRLQDQIADDHQLLMMSDGQIIRLRNQIIDDNQELIRNEEQLIRLQTQIVDDHIELMNSEGQIIRLQRQIVNDHAALMNSDGQIINLERALVDADGQITKLENQITDQHIALITENDLIQQQLLESNNLVEQHSERIDQLVDLNGDKDDIIEERDTDLQNARNINIELRDELAKFKADREQMVQNARNAKTFTDNQEGLLQNARDINTQLKDEAGTLQELVRVRETDITEKEELINQLREQIDELAKGHDGNVAKLLADQHKEFERLRQEARDNENANIQRIREELQGSHDRAQDDNNFRREGQIKKLQDEHKEELNNVEDGHRRALEVIKDEHAAENRKNTEEFNRQAQHDEERRHQLFEMPLAEVVEELVNMGAQAPLDFKEKMELLGVTDLTGDSGPQQVFEVIKGVIFDYQSVNTENIKIEGEIVKVKEENNILITNAENDVKMEDEDVKRRNVSLQNEVKQIKQEAVEKIKFTNQQANEEINRVKQLTNQTKKVIFDILMPLLETDPDTVDMGPQDPLSLAEIRDKLRETIDLTENPNQVIEQLKRVIGRIVRVKTEAVKIEPREIIDLTDDVTPEVLRRSVKNLTKKEFDDIKGQINIRNKGQTVKTINNLIAENLLLKRESKFKTEKIKRAIESKDVGQLSDHFVSGGVLEPEHGFITTKLDQPPLTFGLPLPVLEPGPPKPVIVGPKRRGKPLTKRSLGEIEEEEVQEATVPFKRKKREVKLEPKREPKVKLEPKREVKLEPKDEDGDTIVIKKEKLKKAKVEFFEKN